MELEHYTAKLLSSQKLCRANSSRARSPEGECHFKYVIFTPQSTETLQNAAEAATNASNPTPQEHGTKARLLALMTRKACGEKQGELWGKVPKAGDFHQLDLELSKLFSVRL